LGPYYQQALAKGQGAWDRSIDLFHGQGTETPDRGDQEGCRSVAEKLAGNDAQEVQY